MQNPWRAVKDGAEIVATHDRAHVAAFNAVGPGQNAPYKLRTGLVPEPWMGDPRNARVLMLLLNPGFTRNDVYWHKKADYRNAAIGNLHLTRSEYPHYLLDPRWSRSPGGTWWRSRLGHLLDALGGRHDEHVVRTLANRFAAVEFHGYHSTRYHQLPITLPTQHFSFGLIERAIEQGKPIIIGRGFDDWCIAIPALLNYEGLVFFNSTQSVYVTDRNLNDGRKASGAFRSIVDALSAGTTSDWRRRD